MSPTKRVNVSIPAELAAAAAAKSDSTGVPVSFVVTRALAHWVATGEIAPEPALAQPAKKESKRKRTTE